MSNIMSHHGNNNFTNYFNTQLKINPSENLASYIQIFCQFITLQISVSELHFKVWLSMLEKNEILLGS